MIAPVYCSHLVLNDTVLLTLCLVVLTRLRKKGRQQKASEGPRLLQHRGNILRTEGQLIEKKVNFSVFALHLCSMFSHLLDNSMFSRLLVDFVFSCLFHVYCIFTQKCRGYIASPDLNSFYSAQICLIIRTIAVFIQLQLVY